jgi:hypothetical protein
MEELLGGGGGDIESTDICPGDGNHSSMALLLLLLLLLLMIMWLCRERFNGLGEWTEPLVDAPKVGVVAPP